jgi:transcriptional regulator with XRE-family HTH domain
MNGRWMATIRKSLGWTQQGLAARLGVARATLAKWETGGDPVPAPLLVRLAQVLAVSPEHLRQQWPVRCPVARLEAVSVFAPHYRVEATDPEITVDDMLELGGPARGLATKVDVNPAVAFEIQRNWPRETRFELLATYHLLAAGMTLEFWSTDEFGCGQLVVERRGFRAAGRLLRHALRWNLPEATLLLWPQVPIAVVTQSRSYRPDFLGLYVGSRQLWFAIELDGKFHRDTANEDARRAVGIGLPELRYQNNILYRSDFPQRLLRDVRRLAGPD